MKRFSQAILFLFLLQTPTIVLAQYPTWIVRTLTDLFGLIPLVVSMLVGVALVVFLIGLVRFILQSGNEEAVKQGKQYMVWGIIALCVLVSVWGIVTILQQISGATNTGAPTTPTTSNPL